MLQELFNEQSEYINYFFENIDMDAANRFLEICKSCTGLMVFTGVGKSGIIAEKIAMTLVSTGTRAIYLPPTNFLHGDIGILSENDVVVVISKSGEAEELISLIPFFRKRGAKFLSIVSNGQSRIGKMSDASICLPLKKELCPFDLAPTTSTAIQLIFGDIIAIALMKWKKFSLDEYALNHPAGAIGRKLILTVENLMITGDNIPFCSPEDKLLNVLVELSNKKCGCLLVVDEKKNFLGIFTDGDLRRALQSKGPEVLEAPMKDLMTVSAIATTKDELAWKAMKIMQKDPKRFIMMLPVLDQNKAVGLIRMHDIVQAGLA